MASFPHRRSVLDITLLCTLLSNTHALRYGLSKVQIRCEWQHPDGLRKHKICCVTKVHYLAFESGTKIKSNILSTVDCTVQFMVVKTPPLHRVGAVAEIKAFVVKEGSTLPVKKSLSNIRILFVDGTYDV